MRKTHGELIRTLGRLFPNPNGIKVRWFGKNKRIEVSDKSFCIFYYDTCVVAYSAETSCAVFNFGDEKNRTNSTASILRDMVEGIFGWTRLPRWNGIIDDDGCHYVFEENCKIEVEFVYLSDLKLK